jgi:glycine cleavage system H lipoate-binding protein
MVPIFFVITILLLVSIDAILQSKKKRETAAQPVLATSPTGFAEGLGSPAGLFLHPGHTWMELQAVGTVRMGLDAFLTRTLGRIDSVRLLVSGSGERIRQGQPLLAVERDGKTVVLPSPVSGTLRTTNKAVTDAPASIAASPYRSWLCVIEPSRLGQELSTLKVAENAKLWLQNEASRFSNWVANLGAGGAVPALPDGGVPPVGVMGELGEAQWADFQQEFLKVEPVAEA